MKNKPTARALAFAGRLRKALDESDLVKFTLTKQARELTISKALLSQWLGARTEMPGYKLVAPVCQRLNIRVDWLLKDEEPMRAERGSPAQDREEVAPSPRPTGVSRMTLQEQQKYICELFEGIPHTARTKWIHALLREALANKWIPSIPTAILAELSPVPEASTPKRERPRRQSSS